MLYTWSYVRRGEAGTSEIRLEGIEESKFRARMTAVGDMVRISR